MCEGNGFKKYKPQIQIRIQTGFPLYHNKVLELLQSKKLYIRNSHKNL